MDWMPDAPFVILFCRVNFQLGPFTALAVEIPKRHVELSLQALS